MPVDQKTILFMLAREFGLERNTIQERLKLQKIIYLLQAYGLGFGYGFSWYRYGPYSQQLVFDAYEVLGSQKSKYNNDTEELTFSNDSRQRLEEFKSICSQILDDPARLELAASVDFVRRTWYPDATEENIPQLLKKHKRRLFNDSPIADEDARKAFALAQKLRNASPN